MCPPSLHGRAPCTYTVCCGVVSLADSHTDRCFPKAPSSPRSCSHAPLMLPAHAGCVSLVWGTAIVHHGSVRARGCGRASMPTTAAAHGKAKSATLIDLARVPD
eukprot:4449839-Prymnesium_polylepis.2